MLIYVLVTAFVLSKTNTCLSIKDGESIAIQISIRLKHILSNLLQHEQLEAKFEELYTNNILTIKRVNTSEISLKFRNNLERLLSKHIDTVLDIKKEAIYLDRNYTFNSSIEVFNYFNRKQDNPVKMEPTFSTNTKVNLNRSHVQVPADIFWNDKIILNEAKWTLPIDKVFLANKEKIPSLLWQYFGTENGMFRSFPGKNTPLNQNDYFDCRRRFWYNEAINSPKDLVIAVDFSGSMTGTHFDIAKLTIKSLIDTLRQNDFFNVIFYTNEHVQYLQNSCPKRLFQAISDNKDALKTVVDSLEKPSGQSSILKILKEAFEVLSASSYNPVTSSTCNQLIMFISDGVDDPKETVQQIIDWSNERHVIIFSYIIGSGTKDAKMKHIACETGGETYQFSTLGNVWDGVLKYQHFLSGFGVSFYNNGVNFSPLYLDSGGQGMMTTISVPVFSESDEKLLGVAGVDIKVNLLEQQYPIQDLGVFGHAFAINDNGLLLVHPMFRDQNGYLPDPATIFLNEVEYTVNVSHSLQLMKDMIDMKIGCMETELNLLYENNRRRIVSLNVTYCFHPIEGTPFKTSVSIPQNNLMSSRMNKEMLESFIDSGIEGLSSNDIGKTIEVADWMFCNIPTKEQENQPISLQFYPTAGELQIHLRVEDYSVKCNEELLSNLLMSSSIISNFTRQSWSHKTIKENNVLQIYLIAVSGYIISLSMLDGTLTNSKPDRNIFNDEKFTRPIAFSTTSQNPKSITVIVPIRERKRDATNEYQDSPVEINIGTSLHSTDHDILEAVGGITVSSDTINKIFLDSIKTKDGDLIPCRNLSIFTCHLLDENGYTVYSNKGYNELGVFYGFINGMLMREFIKLDIFKESIYIDKQAQCGSKEYVGNKETFISKNVSCVKRLLIHKRSEFTLSSYNGLLDLTSECKQPYFFVPVNGTNLALVVIETACKPVISNFILSNEPVRINNPNQCARTLAYKKSIGKCYKFTNKNHDCSNISTEQEEADMKLYITIGSSFITLLLIIYALK